MNSSDIQTVKAIFPDANETVIKSYLNRNNNNVERTVEALLSATPEELKQAENEPLIDDEEFAKQLQKQLNMGSNQSAPQNTQLDDDEEYARKLMAEELAKVNPPFFQYPPHNYTPFQNSPSSYLPSVPQNQYSNFSSTSVQPMKPEDLDETVINELLNSVKKGIIPVLKEGLGEVEIPDISESVETGKVGKISFDIGGIGIDKVEIPEDQMNISLKNSASGTISLEMLGISASLKEFDWSYSKDTFPKLKDSGKAKASISKVNIIANMSFGMGHQGPEMKISDINVNVGNLELKLTGTKVSVLYNVIISFFKGMIKKEIENALQSMVSQGLGSNSINLLNAFD